MPLTATRVCVCMCFASLTGDTDSDHQLSFGELQAAMASLGLDLTDTYDTVCEIERRCRGGNTIVPVPLLLEKADGASTQLITAGISGEGSGGASKQSTRLCSRSSIAGNSGGGGRWKQPIDEKLQRFGGVEVGIAKINFGALPIGTAASGRILCAAIGRLADGRLGSCRGRRRRTRGRTTPIASTKVRTTHGRHSIRL